eukprot:1859557-Amphidinium_carterae.3
MQIKPRMERLQALSSRVYVSTFLEIGSSELDLLTKLCALAPRGILCKGAEAGPICIGHNSRKAYVDVADGALRSEN